MCVCVKLLSHLLVLCGSAGCGWGWDMRGQTLRGGVGMGTDLAGWGGDGDRPCGVGVGTISIPTHLSTGDAAGRAGELETPATLLTAPLTHSFTHSLYLMLLLLLFGSTGCGWRCSQTCW